MPTGFMGLAHDRGSLKANADPRHLSRFPAGLSGHGAINYFGLPLKFFLRLVAPILCRAW